MSGPDYYDDFLQAVWHGGPATPQLERLLAQPAFAVYRNTIFKGCMDALGANFPAVVRLVGDAWFQGAAHAYARDHPPQDACLIAYGAGFPAFLEHLPSAHQLPYLPGVAALDRCWTEVHIAADEPDIDGAALQAALAAGHHVRLVPSASARWRWDAAHPCHAIWDANRRPGARLADDLAWRGEGALLTRPAAQVAWRPLGPGACRFLDACAAGMVVSEAAALALEAEPGLDLAVLLVQLVQAGAYTAFTLPPP